ncbi:MAG TPA: hypothetical protein VMW23_09060, partial [Sedimentisphaerales bacterium]|nr:hypothetical protein [Sedimentisphaerales bacterium]
MKTVLFLGAGFSSAWGLPVMQEFFQHAKNSEYLGDNDKDFLRKLQRKARQGASMLQIENDNLEEVLSFSLASENFNVGYPSQDNNEYNNLCRILQKVYRKAGFKEYDIRDEISAFHVSPLLQKLTTLLGIGQEKLSPNDLS